MTTRSGIDDALEENDCGEFTADDLSALDICEMPSVLFDVARTGLIDHFEDLLEEESKRDEEGRNE